MPATSLNGNQLYYTDTGGDKSPVVFSHGFLMDHTMFDPQVKALAPNYRVITWDQRGHGQSTANEPFTYWDSAADLLALLDLAGIERAVLGGMSQGGFVSMRAALLAPHRVRALILVDTQSGTEDPAAAPLYEQMHETWREHGPATVQEAVASIILGDGQWDDWYAKWAAADVDQFTLAFRALMDRDDITSRIGEIGCPALIVHGTADAAIPVRKAEQLRDRLGAAAGGDVRLALIDGAPHAANLTHPDAVNAEITSFLAGLAG